MGKITAASMEGEKGQQFEEKQFHQSPFSFTVLISNQQKMRALIASMGTGFFDGQLNGLFFGITFLRSSTFNQFTGAFHGFDAGKLQTLPVALTKEDSRTKLVAFSLCESGRFRFRTAPRRRSLL